MWRTADLTDLTDLASTGARHLDQALVLMDLMQLAGETYRHLINRLKPNGTDP